MKATNSVVVAVLLGLCLASGVGSVEVPQAKDSKVKALIDEESSATAKALLGSWKNQANSEDVVRFEATKCTFVQIGQPGWKIYRATYMPGKIVLYSWGKKVEYRFEVKDGVLALTLEGGKTRTYRKLDRTPAEVEVKPLTLAPAKELPKAKIQSLQEELARRGKRDQKVRTDSGMRDQMQRVDADNTKWLIRLVQEVGWIDAQRFGAAASKNAFLIVQHSMHLPLMLAVLPRIEMDVRAKRVDAQFFALLYDRLQLNLGGKQRYCTQIGTNEKGAFVVMPLQDRKRVDELRKEMGLFPLVDYLKLVEKVSGGKKITFEDDE